VKGQGETRGRRGDPDEWIRPYIRETVQKNRSQFHAQGMAAVTTSSGKLLKRKVEWRGEGLWTGHIANCTTSTTKNSGTFLVDQRRRRSGDGEISWAPLSNEYRCMRAPQNILRRVSYRGNQTGSGEATSKGHVLLDRKKSWINQCHTTCKSSAIRTREKRRGVGETDHKRNVKTEGADVEGKKKTGLTGKTQGR